MDGPNFSLQGRVALITGSGRGIGLGMARALASAGCAVAIQDIDLDIATVEAEKINQEGGRAFAFGGDMGDLPLVRGLVDDIVRKAGGLHILINNAAIQCPTPWLKVEVEEVERQWRVNAIAPLLLCQRAFPIFRQQHWGRILNLGSIQQRSKYSGMLPYAMSKSALNDMTRKLAWDGVKDGITVNQICPGYFNTWRNREQFQKPEDLVERGKWIPMGRIGEPHDAGGIALVLCSDAGSYITGQTIYLDGGMHLNS